MTENVAKRDNYQPGDLCWSRIGVFGDRTCGDLAEYIHCHNCPTYHEAGRSLLDRELDVDYLDRQKEIVARQKDLREWTLSVTIFRVEGEWLALPSAALKEITEARVIRGVPHRSGRELLGLANIRGELVICVSLPQLLGITEGSSHEAITPIVWPRLVVAEQGKERWAFPVEEVWGMWWLDPASIQEAPATLANDASSFTRGIFDWWELKVGLLDEESLCHAVRNRSK